jgi:hypothetical protein
MALSAAAQDQAQLLVVAESDVLFARNSATIRGLAKALSIDTLEAAIEDIRARRHDQMVEVDNIQSELARSESDVSLVEARIARDAERLVHTSSAKDAQGLEHELASLRTRQSDLEDIELAIMDNLEGATALLQGISQELATAEEALKVARGEETRRTQELTGANQALADTRSALLHTLPADLVELYERQRERYGIGASHLRRGVSSASGVALTESDLHTIREAPEDEVLLCPDSNAILIRTGESGL